MESGNGNTSSLHSAAVLSSSEKYQLHLSNIQLLAAIDCALALTTLVFNLRQVALVLTNENFPREFRSEEKSSDASHVRLVVAAVASVCLTLTQLLLACLIMTSLSNLEQTRTVQSKTRIICGIWVLWSFILLIILIVYTSNIKRFESFGDQFYLFTLVSEIILRIGIIIYTSLFFWCPCCNHH